MTAQDPQAQIDRFLASSGLASRGARLVPLTGDASDRRYLRVLLPDAPSLILAVYPVPFDPDQLPFVNVARLLSAMPVPVPDIVAASGPDGVLALQDLGDVTLQASLDSAMPVERAALYREAIDLIDTLQTRGRALTSGDYQPYSLAFDVEKLSFELQFFVQHFLEAYRGVTLSMAERTALDEDLLRLADVLAGEPRVLCHRDYHSRNLMLHEGRLHLIDFQDARMGPDTYDLASLLRDSYVDLTSGQVDDLLAYFLTRQGGQADAQEEATRSAAFRHRFDVMAAQRNLKALGTFGFQATARGNPAYAQYMPRTLGYLRDNAALRTSFGRLGELLASHLGELRPW